MSASFGKAGVARLLEGAWVSGSATPFRCNVRSRHKARELRPRLSQCALPCRGPSRPDSADVAAAAHEWAASAVAAARLVHFYYLAFSALLLPFHAQHLAMPGCFGLPDWTVAAHAWWVLHAAAWFACVCAD